MIRYYENMDTSLLELLLFGAKKFVEVAEGNLFDFRSILEPVQLVKLFLLQFHQII